MAFKEKLEVLVDANVQGFVKGFDQAAKSADKLDVANDKAARLSRTLTTTGAALVGVGAVGAVGLGKLATAASNYGEQLSKATVIVGREGVKDLEKFSASAAKTAGISKTAALEASAGFAALGKQAGLQGKELTSFSTRITQLAGDLASFNNTTVDDALQALKSGLQGEQEPLKRFNIFLNDTALKQEYAALTGQKVTTVLTAQQRVVAANSLIFKQSADAIGDFARTSDSLPNRQRQLAAEFENLKVAVGAGVVPVVGVLADGLSAVSQKFADLPSGVQSTAGTIAAIGTVAVTAAGGLTFITGQALKMKDTFTDAEGNITRTGAALRGLAIGAAVIAGVKALDAALTDLTTSSTAAEKSTNDLLASKSATNSLDVLIEKTREVDGAWNDVKQTFSQGGELGQYVKLDGINVDVTNLNKVLGDLAQSKNWSALRNAIEGLQSAKVSKGDTDWLTGGTGGQEGVDRFRKTLKEYEGDLKSADAAQAAAGESAAATGDKVAEAGNKTNEAADAWKNYADSIKATTDPFFAAQKAQEDFAKSQLEIAQAQAEFDKNKTPENFLKLAAAQQAAVRSGLDLQSSLVGIRAGFEDGSLSADQAIGTLEALKQQQPQLAAAIDQTEQAILGVTYAAQGVPSSTPANVSTNAPDATGKLKDTGFFARQIPAVVPLNIQTNAGAVSGTLSDLIAKGQNLARIFGGVKSAASSIAPPTGNPFGLAAGGPIRAGDMHLVGENGPELFVSGVSGSIIPNDKLKGGSAGGFIAGGQTIVQNTNNFYGPVTDEQWVIDAISKANRRGMTSLAP